jgi:Na+/H+-translocating membrane pyrophosphatase
MDDWVVSFFLVFCIVFGLVVTVVYWFNVTNKEKKYFLRKVEEMKDQTDSSALIDTREQRLPAKDRVEAVEKVFALIAIIQRGAIQYLFRMYGWMLVFIGVFGLLLFLMTGSKGKASFATSAAIADWQHTEYTEDWMFGFLSFVSFVVGALTSMAAGYIGMSIAVVANGRVTLTTALGSLGDGFAMAIQGGMVMGFGLLSLGLLNLVLLIGFYSLNYTNCKQWNECELNHMYDALAAYGLGGSSIALFGRVGGGIYTKAADVGADLVGKTGDIEIPEDDCRNPATIADNVGDNVGDIAGMGSDLFGSLAEGTCAAMVVLSSSNNCIYWIDGNVQAVASNFSAMMFPLSITAAGILVCWVTSLFATVCAGDMKPKEAKDSRCTGYTEEHWTQREKAKNAYINKHGKVPNSANDMYSYEGQTYVFDENEHHDSWQGELATWEGEATPTAYRETYGYQEGEGQEDSPVETTLKMQLVISTLLMTPVIFALSAWFLPDSFYVGANLGIYGNAQLGTYKAVCEVNTWDALNSRPYEFGHFPTASEAVFAGTTCMGEKGILAQEVQWWEVAICVTAGLWAGLTIGYITEFYTSKSFRPTREIAEECKGHKESGAAVNIIFGLALGYLSVVIPVIALTIAIYTGYAMAQMFGVASAALGMMSTVAICLTIDGYGPIADNAGGIAEMVPQIPNVVRMETDALDAAGNTTAAIGKGFAIGSAAMVALALFGGYCTRADIRLADVSILEPMCFAGLMFGAMIPYWFSAMTMKSVGKAASDMMKQCHRQFLEESYQFDDNKEQPKYTNALPPVDKGWWDAKYEAGEIKEEEWKDAGYNSLEEFMFPIFDSITRGEPVTRTPPDAWYKDCIGIATDSSLREMVAPACLVLLTPLICGVFFGKFALSGLLIGAIVSGVQVALSASNTGGAWDNAKKYATVDWATHTKMNPEWKKACVIGDTVGDPLKDTSGPAVNIVMKLMAIISLVCAPFIADIRGGYGLIGCSINQNCSD